MSNELNNVSVDDLVFGENAHANLKQALGWCTSVVQSGMLPKHIDTPPKALVVLMKGKELGLSPMVALSSIYVVGGKSEIPGVIMEHLLRRGRVDIEVVEWNDQGCKLLLHREGFTSFPSEFNKAMAERAGLFSNQNYKKYPEDMYYWRALSRGARRIGADLIHGCYVEGEIRQTVRDVEVETTKPAPRASSQAKLADRLGLAPTEDIDPDTGEIVPPPSETLPGMDDNDAPKWDEMNDH